MLKIVIFGNSGSGKSTLAKKLSTKFALVHLDLDSLAWKPCFPPERKTLKDCKLEIDAFINSHENWVIEGCYSDLISLILENITEMIFLNLSIEQCIENARNRPWESHKYKTKADQDNNLEMLINWISSYSDRDDELSQKAHESLFANYKGKKTQYTTNIEDIF